MCLFVPLLWLSFLGTPVKYVSDLSSLSFLARSLFFLFFLLIFLLPMFFFYSFFCAFSYVSFLSCVCFCISSNLVFISEMSFFSYSIFYFNKHFFTSFCPHPHCNNSLRYYTISLFFFFCMFRCDGFS